MKRFILITFGFMAWGFYELSGGDEFEPASARLEASTPVTQAELPAVDAPTPAPEVAPEVTTIIDTDPPLVAESPRPTVDVTNLANVAQAVAEQPVPENLEITSTTEETAAIIPSLIVQTDTSRNETTETAEATQFATSEDVRTVSGNRVNVRGGPGTDFGVVTKLGRGDEVVILQDNGDGWVKMRPVDGGPEGWMADFLLTSS